MLTPAQEGERRRNLLLTLVMIGLLMTPAWFSPTWLRVPWMVAGLVFGLPAAWVSWRYTPWLPTPTEDLARVVRLLDLRPGQRFCDLGAGEGRMVLHVAASTGADATGIELSPFHWLIGRLRLLLQGNERTHLVLGDFHRVDLSGYDALYLWGTSAIVATPEFLALTRRLKRGARLVCHHHPIPGLEPDSVDVDGRRPIRVYVMPPSPVVTNPVHPREDG